MSGTDLIMEHIPEPGTVKLEEVKMEECFEGFEEEVQPLCVNIDDIHKEIQAYEEKPGCSKWAEDDFSGVKVKEETSDKESKDTIRIINSVKSEPPDPLLNSSCLDNQSALNHLKTEPENDNVKDEVDVIHHDFEIDVKQDDTEMDGSSSGLIFNSNKAAKLKERLKKMKEESLKRNKKEREEQYERKKRQHFEKRGRKKMKDAVQIQDLEDDNYVLSKSNYISVKESLNENKSQEGSFKSLTHRSSKTEKKNVAKFKIYIREPECQEKTNKMVRKTEIGNSNDRKKALNRERQRRYMAKIKANEELRQIYSKKEKERYKRKQKAAKKNISINNLTPSQKKSQREKWREAKQKYRQRKKRLNQDIENASSNSEASTPILKTIPQNDNAYSIVDENDSNSQYLNKQEAVPSKFPKHRVLKTEDFSNEITSEKSFTHIPSVSKKNVAKFKIFLREPGTKKCQEKSNKTGRETDITSSKIEVKHIRNNHDREKALNRERQRRYIAKIKSNKELRQMYREQQQERYKKRKAEEKIVSIKKLTPSQKEYQREKWREAKQKYRQRKKDLTQIIENTPSNNGAFTPIYQIKPENNNSVLSRSSYTPIKDSLTENDSDSVLVKTEKIEEFSNEIKSENSSIHIPPVHEKIDKKKTVIKTQRTLSNKEGIKQIRNNKERKKALNRERQRRYIAKIRSNEELMQIHREQQKKYKQRKATEKIKSRKKLTPQQKKYQREKWREEKQKYRLRKKHLNQVIENTPSLSGVLTPILQIKPENNNSVLGRSSYTPIKDSLTENDSDGQYLNKQETSSSRSPIIVFLKTEKMEDFSNEIKSEHSLIHIPPVPKKIYRKNNATSKINLREPGTQKCQEQTDINVIKTKSTLSNKVEVKQIQNKKERKKALNRERQRRYIAKIRNNEELMQIHREQQKKYKQRKATEKIISTKKLTPQQKKIQREKWREAKQKYRQQKKDLNQVIEETSANSEAFTSIL